MTILAWVLVFSAFGAVLALVMSLINLRLYRPAPALAAIPENAMTGNAGEVIVSVCVPARNEERNLKACVEGVLASRGIDLEVLVYDDQSTDETPRILEALMAADPRVRRVATRELPSGWNGKQHACWRMAQEARGRWMLFTDADVRFRPDALARSVACADGQGLGMLSTFPRQVTGTLSERLVVPMIFFILFSYLPFVRMRKTKDPAASAGCGQFLLVRKDAYEASGGHQGFKNSMHDGIMMPRAVRRAGFATDLFDGTELVSCRMYAGLGQVWRGFTKNAYEGLGSVGLLVFLTVMHALAHVLPWVVVVLALAGLAGVPGLDFTSRERMLAGACVIVSLSQRLMLAWRLQTPFTGAVLHPVGVVLMTVIQWHSFVLAMTGRRSWRGRTATA